MKNQIRLSALALCVVSLTIGCARTNGPAKKPEVKPAAVTPEQQLANELNKTLSTPAGAIAAGSLSEGVLAAGSLSAGSLSSAAEGAQVEPVPAVAETSEITSAAILDFVNRLDLPLVLSFSLPKHDVKEEVPRFVGIGCDREVAKARSVKTAGNLAKQLADDLCYTNVLRQGSPKVVVVPGKLITRHTKTSTRAGSIERMYEVALRADSSVSAIRETIKKGADVPEVHTTIVDSRGAILSSDVTPKSSTMIFDWKNGTVRYESKSMIGNGKVITASKKLFARGYKGLNLILTEESPTAKSEDVTCNVIAVKQSNLNIAMSETLEGRCFHRK